MNLPEKEVLVDGRRRRVLDVAAMTDEQWSELADRIFGGKTGADGK